MGSLELTPTTGVVVTGGASGIGRACADALAQAGRPVALWDLDGDAARTAAGDIANARGVTTVGLNVDVTDVGGFSAAADESRSALGTIGGLVHSAGVVRVEPVGSITADAWGEVLDVNLRAEALLVQALLPDLRASPGAAVVGIASIEGLVGHGAIPAYCASKAGLLGLTRALAVELGPHGIRVNAVCPGYTETPMLALALDAGLREQFEASSCLGRIGQPEDTARAVRFLLSDEASFVTGTYIVVDGGVVASA